MKRANDESPDSPFVRNKSFKSRFQTKLIKQKLNGGVSAESPVFFHITHTEILDKNSRMKELFKGYQTTNKLDFKLLNHPELVHQDKKPFLYEDFQANKGKTFFDYSSVKGSNFIDLVNDKRPDLKKNSKFYERYNERLNTKGFGIPRGMFTVESNLRTRFGTTFTSSFEKSLNGGKQISQTFRTKESVKKQDDVLRSQSTTFRKYLDVKGSAVKLLKPAKVS